MDYPNLVPRVLRLFGQRDDAWRDSGIMVYLNLFIGRWNNNKKYGSRMNRKPFKNFYFFDWLWLKSGSQRKRNNIARHFRPL